MDKPIPEISLESWLVSAGRDSVPGAPLNVPLVPASNFILGRGREYSRDDGTPTWEALEEIVGGLESGKAVAFASGMAAIASVFDQLAAGAVVVLPDDCYQGVAGLAAAGAEKRRWTVQRVPVDDTAGWIRACGIADLIWLESPSNPLLTVADLEAICAAPRKPGALVAVDNTFATPLNQQPLAFGATVSLQSATKFIGGHSDLLAGVATTKDKALWQALRKSRELTGATPGGARGVPRRPRRPDSRTSVAKGPANGTDAGGAAGEASAGHSGSLSRLAFAPDARGCQARTQGFRHHHLVRRAWRR